MKEISQDSLTVLEYEITNSDKLCGQGNINSIRKEQGYWKSYIGTNKTKLKCVFKTICRPVCVELKVKNVNIFEITSYIDKDEIVCEGRSIISKQREGDTPIQYKIKNQITQADEIHVDLHSFNKKQVQINWLRFKGQVVRPKPQKRRESIKKANSEIFNERIKQSTQKISPKVEKEQKCEAIEEAKPTLPKQNTKAQLDIVVVDEFQSQELMSQSEPQVCKFYQVQNVEASAIQKLEGVSQKWLEAQRKMETTFGVKVEHKLSWFISPKCLIGMKFCLPNIYGAEKSKYVKLVKQLGGTITEELCAGCIVATNRPKGSKIFHLAPLMADTFIVRLSYLDDCYESRTKLKLNKYGFSAQQFLN